MNLNLKLDNDNKNKIVNYADLVPAGRSLQTKTRPKQGVADGPRGTTPSG